MAKRRGRRRPRDAARSVVVVTSPAKGDVPEAVSSAPEPPAVGVSSAPDPAAAPSRVAAHAPNGQDDHFTGIERDFFDRGDELAREAGEPAAPAEADLPN